MKICVYVQGGGCVETHTFDADVSGADEVLNVATEAGGIYLQGPGIAIPLHSIVEIREVRQ